MFSRIFTSALIIASVAYASVLPATSSSSSGGSGCEAGTTLCCDSQTTDDLLSGVAGTLQSVVGALLQGGPVSSCERGGADTCAVQPICCSIPVLQPGATLLSIQCSPLSANL